SALSTMRLPRAPPTDMMRAYCAPCEVFMVKSVSSGFQRGLAGVRSHEGACVVDLVWRVQREELDALQVSLCDPGERTGRGQFEQSGDTLCRHGFHAQVPAHGVGHLRDDP